MISNFVEAQNTEVSSRVKMNINQGWKFHLGDSDAKNYELNTDDSNWEIVNVPHALELTSMSLNDNEDDKYQKTFMRNVGWYRKHINVSNNTTNKVFIEFEGVHQVTDVWVNGKHVGNFSVGGYSPFHFDITDFVNYGEKNLVTVLADNRRREDVPPDPGPMDYIKFGGMYRDVYLVETNQLHVTFNWESDASGQFITTPTVDPINMNGTINIKTAVKNETAISKKTTVVNQLIDDKGVVVLKLSETKNIVPNAEVVFNQIGSIEDNVRLWSIDDPYLYRVHTIVYDNDKITDEIECKTGFRKIEISKTEGILLNGKPIKLIGTNRHQHYGYIGDAMPNSLHYKDVLQLKQLGMNVLRTAHYPHDNAILEACDELGILVYEEAPTWLSIGNKVWFDNFEKAARIMVRNHRNHPSVIIWGAGINHRGYVAKFHNIIKQEDPFRFTASQSSAWTGWQTSGLTDIYAQMVYGPYYWSGDEPILAMEGRRGPEAVNAFMNNPMKLGLISWTAHAYYTFHPTKTPKDRSRGGFMTVFRSPKAGLLWYKAELTKTPFTHIESDWNENTQEVVIYSNAKKVQLAINNKIITTQEPSKKDDYKYLKHAPFIFKISNYEKGKLTASGLVEGNTLSSATTYTAEVPSKIILELDTYGVDFIADGSDILVAHAKVVDKNGTIIKDTNFDISFSLKGDASIIGDKEKIGSNPKRSENGIAPVLIRAGMNPETITITAKAKGLKSATVTITTKPSNFNETNRNSKPIYDFESIKVDIGENEQIVQFDWIPWNSEDKKSSTKTFNNFDGFSATLKSVDTETATRWLGEINVIGKYGFANGEGVFSTSENGLSLEFKNLKKGSYKLNTVHHAPRTNTDSMDPNQEKIASYRIYKIPYATSININIYDANGTKTLKNIKVTEGKNMQTEPFGSAEILFESDGINPVTITFNDIGNKGVWLNSFVLSEWF